MAFRCGFLFSAHTPHARARAHPSTYTHTHPPTRRGRNHWKSCRLDSRRTGCIDKFPAKAKERNRHQMLTRITRRAMCDRRARGEKSHFREKHLIYGRRHYWCFSFSMQIGGGRRAKCIATKCPFAVIRPTDVFEKNENGAKMKK